MQNVLYYLKKYGKDVVTFILLLVLLIFMICSFYLKEEKDSNGSEDNLVYTDLSNKENVETEKENIKTKIFVDVKGAVKKPGVYEIENNAIINDVIKLAGGFNTNAYKDGINLSKKLKDETVIYVYTKTEIKNIQEENNKTNNNINATCNTPDYNICECVNEKDSVIETGKDSTNKNDSVIETGKDSTNKNDSVIEAGENTTNKIDSVIEIGENSTNKNDSNLETQMVNINSASVNELTTLSGIGESKALAIIKYREDNGCFAKIEDIMNVSGIGEKAFEKIKDFITI